MLLLLLDDSNSYIYNVIKLSC